MNFVDLQVQVHPGDGLVANFGAAILVGAPDDGRQSPLLDELLATVAGSVASDGATAGRRLARQVVKRIASAEPEDVPPFCLLAAVDCGVAVILHGALDLEVSGPSGKERLSGRKVAAWVDQIVEAPFERLLVAPSGQPVSEPDARSDLREGVVPGNGVSLSTRTTAPLTHADASAAAVAPASDDTIFEPPPKPPPPPPVGSSDFEPATDFVSVALAEAVPEEKLAPLPVVGAEPSAPAEEVDEAVLVEGIVCSRGHFGDPSSAYCASCGISMVHRTHNLVEGRRPPLGVAVLDDGSTYVLDGDYVIGREPEEDPEVLAGRVRRLAVNDPERTVSRVHARIELQGWDVNVRDSNSSNGTYVAQPGATEWTRLTPHETITIRPGARLLVGDRTFVFESHHKS